MKLTLCAGLLLAGASFPALGSLALEDGGPPSPPAAGVARALEPQDELRELYARHRELVATIEELERGAEIERLEQALVLRRELRAEQRALAERHFALEMEHEELEARLERELEQVEHQWSRSEEELERALCELEEDFELRSEREERQFDLQLRKKLHGSVDDDESELLAAQMELERSEREAALREEARARRRQLQAEGEERAGGLAAERERIRSEGYERLRHLEREMASAEHSREEHEEEGEARAELNEMRAEIEAERRRNQVELEIEEVERRIEELEQSHEQEEDDDGDCVAVEEEFGEDDHDLEGLEGILEALERLQEEVDRLREEVDAIWKRLGAELGGDEVAADR